VNKKAGMTGIALMCLWSGLAVADFVLQSPDVLPGKTLSQEQVYSGFGCSGDNISPELKWSGEPEGTKSFAVTVYDPDAPTGSGWWHWLIYNIPATVHKLDRGAGDPEKGKAPAGSVQARTDFGTAGYGGACPPRGSDPHRYQFKVFALDVDKLNLPADASAAFIGFSLNAHTLGTAGIEALYQR